MDDLARSALVLAGDHLDGVALLDRIAMAQSTSGASETIFMNFLSRSSRPTGPKMRVPRGLAVVLDDHGGVLVEPDVGAVGTTALLVGADDDGLDDVALLHVAAGDRVLDGGDDDVADAGVATTGATENPDAQDLLGAGVVGDSQSRLLLDHVSSWLSAVLARASWRNGLVTWPSRGSRPGASAWSLTADGSP